MSHLIKSKSETEPSELLTGKVYEIVNLNKAMRDLARYTKNKRSAATATASCAKDSPDCPQQQQLQPRARFRGNMEAHNQPRCSIFGAVEAGKVFQDIVDQESRIGLIKHESKLKENIQLLKKKMRFYGDSEQITSNPHQHRSSSQDIDENYPIKKNRPLELGKDYEKVYIDKKYNNTLSVKLNAIREIQQIGRYRDCMQKWKNKKYNNVVASPNFTKMNFLIYKLKVANRDKEVLMPLEHAQSSCGILRNNDTTRVGYNRLSKFKSQQHFNLMSN